MSKFIGSKKIKGIFDNPDDKDGVIIAFKDNTESRIKKKLYEYIVKEVKGNGESVNDIGNAYIASKFIKELSDYGYEVYQMEGIASAMGNIVYNLSQAKIGEKFGVKSPNNIKLSDIL